MVYAAPLHYSRISGACLPPALVSRKASGPGSAGGEILKTARALVATVLATAPGAPPSAEPVPDASGILHVAPGRNLSTSETALKARRPIPSRGHLPKTFGAEGLPRLIDGRRDMLGLAVASDLPC